MNENKREELVKKVTGLIGEVMEAMKEVKTTPNEKAKSPYNGIVWAAKKTYASPNTEIFEYIKERKHGISHKVGIIWGTVDGDTIKIGWSKCNRKANDEFDLLLGLEMAKNRAYGHDTAKVRIPDRNRQQMREFVCRSIRYFKGAKAVQASI
jgi:hypothetical protein